MEIICHSITATTVWCSHLCPNLSYTFSVWFSQQCQFPLVFLEFLLWPHVLSNKTECAEVVMGSEHALTDEVCLATLQITVIQPVNGHGSNFPLSNLEIWMYHCAAKFNWMELHRWTCRFKTCASSPKDSQQEVSGGVQQRMWYYILKAFFFKSICFEQFQRKIINWTIKHFHRELLLCKKCSGDFIGEIERMLVWSIFL